MSQSAGNDGGESVIHMACVYANYLNNLKRHKCYWNNSEIAPGEQVDHEDTS